MTTTSRNPELLRARTCRLLQFYWPDIVDRRFGGYVAQLDERDGHVYDGRSKHLVATCRAIHNFAIGVAIDGPTYCRAAAEHGLHFLRHVQWDEEDEGYDWLLSGRETADDTRHCYGHAFAVLATARAVEVGLPDANAELERALGVLDERFFEPEYGLYADAASGDWSAYHQYRGQNANMHACEALLAAYEATGDEAHLDRAATVAASLVRDRADEAGRVWEHYTTEWEPDLAYNRDEPDHLFRPWGYQPGHHAEWAKLLCHLAEHRDDAWLVPRAKELFDTAVAIGWDENHGGFHYTVDESGEPVVADKYGWALAEGIGAAARLAVHDETYLEWYDRLQGCATDHVVNPRFGNWYERLSHDWSWDGPNHGTAVEPGYHPVANQHVAMDVFEEHDELR
ncbi:AGE family epimerase/isomerase [Halococcus agarilyticus]|uniref:AGE family epimerase/isomerase n=1 Tax=Halococcus agarilyticus TaxID=1232219 RepID=UPI000677C9CC|nr:AGE family epimerase/isomerase [Halococcus agarilyticus]